MQINSAIAGSSIPDELTGPVPRRTSTTGQGTAFLIAGPLILLIAACIAVSTTVEDLKQMHNRTVLRSTGVETEGRKTKLSPGGRGEDEKLQYSFVVDGQRYMGEARVPLEHLHAIAYSLPVPVRYAPANPLINYPAAWEWSPNWMLMFPFLLTIGMGSILVIAVQQERRLVALGISVDAIVSDCREGKSGYGVSYEFQTAEGSTIQGRGWSEDFKDTGDKICVLYLPQNPKRNQSYPGQMILAE